MRGTMHLKITASIVLSLIMSLAAFANTKEIHAFIGTYTGTSSRGIYSITLDLESGRMSPPTLAAEATDPSFLAYSPDLKSLYAVDESGGRIRAFAVEKNHTLRPLSDRSTGAGTPADLAVDPSGRMLVAAVYGGGAVVGFPLEKDGSLGERSALVRHSGQSVNAARQEAPHAHGVTYSPDGTFVAIPDLGIDQVRIYRVDGAAGQLAAPLHDHLAIEAGSGPRHAVFSPDGRFLYVINELFSTITVASFDDKSGALVTRQTVKTLPPGFKGNSTTAEIALHPNGRFVYGSNRGHDSIAIFSRDDRTGALTFVDAVSTGGRTPRHFALTPDGRWLVAANQDTDTLVVFRVDGKAGTLAVVGSPVGIPRPVCVRFASYP